MHGNENDEETYSDSGSGDHDYTQGDDPTTDDEDDNDHAPADRPSAKTGKGSKRDRSNTMFAEGMRAVEKKKSKQDLRGREQQSELVQIDLTGSRMSRKLQHPATSRVTISKPPPMMKATETQILSTDRAVFNLAKPILASMLYINDPWPSSIQRENAMCDRAWGQALDTQASQLRAVGALQAWEDLGSSGNGPSKVLDSLARAVVSSYGVSKLHC